MYTFETKTAVDKTRKVYLPKSIIAEGEIEGLTTKWEGANIRCVAVTK